MRTHTRLGIVGSLMPGGTDGAQPRWPDNARHADIAELRADHLSPDEMSGWLAAAPGPTIVTIRRSSDGGGFDGSEDERRQLLTRSLDEGATFIDVELDSELASTFLLSSPKRVLLSHHADDLDPSSCAEHARRLLATSAAYVKLVPTASSVSDLATVKELLAASDGRLIHFAMGRAGRLSRLLAFRWGGAATYGSLTQGSETAAGQWCVDALRKTFAVNTIGPQTPLQFLLGREVYSSPSPAMHRAAAREHDLETRYLPLELDDLDHLQAIESPEGLAVTVPFKEAIVEHCKTLDPVASVSRSVNTMRRVAGQWHGANTDGPATVQLVSKHLDLDGARVQILGAGGTAAAIAVALTAVGAKVVIANRHEDRARDLASRVGADWGPADPSSWSKWDLLVQTTPCRTLAELSLAETPLTGGLVMDAVYGPDGTELTRQARAEGLAVVDGLDLLIAQGSMQFQLLNECPADEALMRAAASQWLSP
ncbi:MAG: type I 3-dehydroquinate dehydratase [Acidobacteriota bacterium]|nr:type I 3-dehydroquinate dehydratase [Acidobacteriota bacterium]